MGEAGLGNGRGLQRKLQGGGLEREGGLRAGQFLLFCGGGASPAAEASAPRPFPEVLRFSHAGLGQWGHAIPDSAGLQVARAVFHMSLCL